jgi:hypothetical protein
MENYKLDKYKSKLKKIAIEKNVLIDYTNLNSYDNFKEQYLYIKKTQYGGNLKTIENMINRITKGETLSNNESLDALKTCSNLLTESETRIRNAEERADTLFKRYSQNHIKRDWEQTALNKKFANDSEFPDGPEIKKEFNKFFENIETFFTDVITSLESMGYDEMQSIIMLIMNISLPIYNGCNAYIDSILNERKELMKSQFGVIFPTDETNDNIVKLFWFLGMQKIIPKIIKSLTDTNISDLISHIDTTYDGKLAVLDKQMSDMRKRGEIDDSEYTLTIPLIIHRMLIMFTYSKLSDPYCYIQPQPGTIVSYNKDFCREILSPGTKIYGRINEGMDVQVVFPGLYFEDSTDKFNTTKPISPCLVRRMKKNLT